MSPVPTPNPPSSGPLPRGYAEPGALRFKADSEPWQRSLRAPVPTGLPRRWRRRIAAVAALALVAELVAFAVWMEPPPRIAVPRPVQVRLIETAPPVPPPPEPSPPPRSAQPPPRIPVAAPELERRPPPPATAEAADGMQAELREAAPSGLRLLNADGSLRGVPELAPAPAPETERARARADWARIEERGNPIDCQKTRFAGAFESDESLGDRIASRYGKWIGLADPQGIAERRARRAYAGGCDPAE